MLYIAQSKMKRHPLLLIMVLFALHCMAQDTVRRRNKLTNRVIEKYYVLKDNPALKEGPYMAFFNRRKMIAEGNYKMGEKAGVWRFFNKRGELNEIFSYSRNTFLYEGPVKNGDGVFFLFDTTATPKDTVTRPLKTGGCYYGMLPYVTAFRAPFDENDGNMDYFSAWIELLISPLGQLADYKVHVVSAIYQYKQTYELDTRLFSKADREFYPATINGKPIMCRIIIRCALNPDGTLDFY